MKEVWEMYLTRISYKLQTTGWHHSAPILTGYGHTIAAYNMLELKWRLYSYDSEATILEGTAKNMHSIRRILKRELVSMGAVFQDEIRKS